MKELLGVIPILGLFSIFGFGYINNIIWLIDNWSIIEFGSKFLNIIGFFFPPLGSILGIVHFM